MKSKISAFSVVILSIFISNYSFAATRVQCTASKDDYTKYLNGDNIKVDSYTCRTRVFINQNAWLNDANSSD